MQQFSANTDPPEFSAKLSPGVAVPGPPGPQGPQGDPGPAGPQGPPGSITPWTGNVDGGGFDLTNAGNIDVTGNFSRNGVPLAIRNQSVVTGARAAGVVYQNTTGKTMFVISSWDLSGKASTLAFLSDGANPPTTEVSQISDPSNTAGIVHSLFCLVLPGNYYQCSVTAGSPTLVSWVEYT